MPKTSLSEKYRSIIDIECHHNNVYAYVCVCICMCVLCVRMCVCVCVRVFVHILRILKNIIRLLGKSCLDSPRGRRIYGMGACHAERKWLLVGNVVSQHLYVGN